jgi:hypothetical protein
MQQPLPHRDRRNRGHEDYNVRKHEHASDARFSVDGRFLAFRFDDLRGHTPVVGLVDLVGDHTPRIVECGETSMFDFAWAPDDDRPAMVCGGRLDVVSAETGLVASSTVLPFKGEIFMELAWSDAARWSS